MKLLVRLFSILLFVAAVGVMLAVIPDAMAQDPTPTLTPTVVPMPACQLYRLTVPEAAVRACAGLDCRVEGGVTDDDTLCILGPSETPDWWLISLEPQRMDAPVRYISAEVVEAGPPGFEIEDATCEAWEVIVDEAIVRQCAGSGCAVLGGLPRGTALCVLEYGGEYQDWLYLDYSSMSSSLQGWMSVDVAQRMAADTVVEAPAVDSDTRVQATDTAQLAPPTFTPMPTLPVCPPGTVTTAAGADLPSYAAAFPYLINYTVQSGDTLIGLAQQFGSTAEAVREANLLGANATIIVGQQLLVPVTEPQAGYETQALTDSSGTPLACVTPTPAPLLAAAPARTTSGPFISQDFALSSFDVANIELSSPRGAALFTFSVPSNWLLDGNNVLYLNAEYFEAIPDGVNTESHFLVSSLDVYLDDELISSVTLTENNIGNQTLIIPLPSELLTIPDENTHTLQLVMEAEDHCLTDSISRLFIRSDLSYFHFEHHNYFPRLDLARFPEPFYNSEIGGELENLLMVLPDNPSESDLEAAAGVAAGFGLLTFNELQLLTVQASELTDAQRRDNNLLMIGQVGEHALIDELYAANALLTTRDGDEIKLGSESVAESDGIVQLIANPDNEMKAIGVVTGTTEVALRKAAQALSGPPSILGLGGPLALIEDTREVGQAAPGTRFETTMTFEDLGVDQLVLTGIGSQIAEVRFFAPAGAQLAPDAYIDLMFTFSGALGRGSNISVLMNDTPILSAFLHSDDEGIMAFEADAQGRNHLKGSIPSESVVPGQRNTITLVLDARETIECVFPDSLVTWFNVSPDSELFLPREYIDPAYVSQQVGWFPVPFNTLPDLRDMFVSLPDEPTSLDYQQAFQLLARIGSETVGGVAFKPTINVGELPVGLDLADYNVLVLGRPTTNMFLAELNTALPQPFVPGTDAIQQTLDDISYRLPAGYDIGLLEALQSPWAADRSILVVSGTGPQGQIQAVGAIAQNLYGRSGLAGDVVFVSATDISVVDTRDLYYVEDVAEELEAIQTSSAVQPSPTVNLVYTVTPGPTSTATPQPSATPLIPPTDIFPTEVVPTPLPTFEPLPQEQMEAAAVQQPAWVNTLLIVTGVVLATTLIFGLLLLARSRRNG